MEDKNNNYKSRAGRYTKRRRSKSYYFKAWLAALGAKKLTLLIVGALLIVALPITAGVLLSHHGTASAETGERNLFSLKSRQALSLSADGSSGRGNDPEALLVATPAPTPEPTPTPEPRPENTIIKYGIEADCVYEIQERLMELGYMDYDEPTNYFGEITEGAVKLFQRQVGLSDDGCVGMETWSAMLAEDAPHYTVMQGMDGTDVSELQKRLRDLGYMDAITGHFGDLTIEAVKKFQANNKLSQDGQVGSHTREVLYSEDAVANFFKYGEQSDEIKSYQERLKKLGYLTTTPDGHYGKDTVNAVKRFQQVNGLTADGFLGYNTIKTLKSSHAQANALKLGMDGSDVSNVQTYLKKLGYMSKVTGYYGEMTEEAVKAFQKRNGLSADGTVGKVTLNLLTSSKAKKAATSSSPSTTSKTTSKTTTKPSKDSSKNTKESSNVPSANGSKVDKFISVAKGKLGCKYVFGSKGPSTFDCSGFVYYCLNQAGVSQGYMTSASWAKSTKYPKITSMSKLERGDILVFDGHVGIYLGGGSMINASSSAGKVRENSINTSYWQNHFICAFRVF